MMSKAEAYVFYASFHASDAREDEIDEKYELFANAISKGHIRRR